MPELNRMLKQARDMTWQRFGKRITFYLPGIFSYNGFTGKYPAISITGTRCDLQCDHCNGRILESMVPACTPESLLEQCLYLADNKNQGVLISGGCDGRGRLPWNTFAPAIRKIKDHTELYVSVHSGLVNYDTALALKDAGVDQVLIDVIGDDETFRKIYHVPFGVSRIISAIESLKKAALSVIPHIVCGLDYGEMKGEKKAVGIISQFDVEQVVIVSLMGIPNTPIWGSRPPEPSAVAEIIAEARFKMPETELALGCARQRGNARLEMLAIDAGVNRIALPSDEAIERAKAYGMEIRYQRTCCSVSQDMSKERW